MDTPEPFGTICEPGVDGTPYRMADLTALEEQGFRALASPPAPETTHLDSGPRR